MCTQYNVIYAVTSLYVGRGYCKFDKSGLNATLIPYILILASSKFRLSKSNALKTLTSKAIKHMFLLYALVTESRTSVITVVVL